MGKSYEVSEMELRLGNLYLAHVIACVTNSKVGNSEPDERLMRFIEWESQIPETECRSFREFVVSQVKEHRLDGMYAKIGETLEMIIKIEPDVVSGWFEKHPIIPVVKV